MSQPELIDTVESKSSNTNEKMDTDVGVDEQETAPQSVVSRSVLIYPAESNSSNNNRKTNAVSVNEQETALHTSVSPAKPIDPAESTYT